MTKEEFLKSGLIEQHVLGLTSPEEEEIVDHFLQMYPELKAEVEELHNAMQSYANQYAIPTPEAQSIGTVPASQGAQAVAVKTPAWWVYAAMVILGGLCFWFWRGDQQNQQRITQLEAEYAALASYCDQHEQKARAVQALYDKTKLPTTHKLVLKGTGLAPDCFAVAYWNPDLKEGWLDPTKLPNLPADKQYQVWADVNGEMISIGLIPTGNNNLVTINYLPEAESINITEEVLGGAGEPTVALLTANGYL